MHLFECPYLDFKFFFQFLVSVIAFRICSFLFCKFDDYFVEFKNFKVACFLCLQPQPIYRTQNVFLSFDDFCTRQSTALHSKSYKAHTRIVRSICKVRVCRYL